jgi:TonB family protein
MPDWKQCVGQLVNGEFPLDRYLGGTETAALYLTRLASGRAAIRIEGRDRVQGRQLVERWNRAADLHHPHLAEVYAAGIGTLAGAPVAYLITEYAEENLAEVLGNRPLTPEETREMLLPVVDALVYLHSQGLVHGDLKPSNILAVADTVKLSREAVSTGESSEDIRALGATIVEAMTGRAVPPHNQDLAFHALPFPFRTIAEHCLQPDPERRWSADQIAASLRSPGQPTASVPSAMSPATEAARPRPGTRRYVAIAALVVAGAASIGMIAMRRTDRPKTAAEPTQPGVPTQQGVPTQPGVSTRPPDSAPPQAPPGPTPATGTIPPDRSDHVATRDRLAQDEITRRVLPKIPEKARNTIDGKPTVVVRVGVNPAGKVVEATVESSFSPYFSKLVLEAARQWRFAPEETALRNWILRFEITRSATQVTARRAGRK